MNAKKYLEITSAKNVLAVRNGPSIPAWSWDGLQQVHPTPKPRAAFSAAGFDSGDPGYELRASYQGVHYRMLYFFHGRAAVVISHGITKEREVAPAEIDRAVRAKASFEVNPAGHTFRPGRS
ncbi:MAG: type II toxin-antitoxin system RelE/ParE family toxin [Terriglobia bacterium]